MNGRNYTRVNYSTGASIRFDNEMEMCKTDNLSLRGMYLKTDIDIPLKSSVNVTVYHSSHSSLKVNANVVRKDVNGVGLQIISINADSFSQLRDIVATNSVDPGKVMQETFGMLKCIY
ncbi:MAG: PilZ domain-containing protein [Desulfuromonadaceae bacterium]|nr:PilZ domain-containing protein [Desulfuromonadaceae bacterium]